MIFSLFNSCTDDKADISNVNATLVFDYKDEKSLPETFLSVFCQTLSDSRRCEKITVKSIKTGYTWYVDSTELFSSDRKEWAGSAELVSPEGKKIPDGVYHVTYEDGQGNTEDGDAYISYPEKLYSTKAGGVDKLLENKYTVYVSLYDEKGILVYYGQKKSEWTNDQQAFQASRTSDTMRYTYVLKENPVIILMPVINRQGKNND